MFIRNKAGPLIPIINSWRKLNQLAARAKKTDIEVTFKFGNRVIINAIIINIIKVTSREIKLQIFLPKLGLENIILTPWSFSKKKQRSRR